MTARQLARRAVLATSVPPLLQLYRAGYALVIRLTVRIFRRFPEVRSVYLRRGASKGEIVPLVSDLDFAVIGGPFTAETRQELHRSYDRLARATSLLDGTLEVFDEETFASRFRRSPHYRYRFTEGRSTWKLLYGRDVLRDLPELSLEELRGGCFAEVQIWWMLFAWRLLQRRRYHAEAATRNSLCYKTVAELLKIDLALRTERLLYRRADALDEARERLAGDDRELVDQLRASARRRFRTAVPGVLERTTGFVLRHGSALCDLFGTLEARADGGAPHEIAAERPYAFRDAPAAEQVQRILEHAERRWPDVRRVAAAAGTGFNVDEVLVVLEMEPGALPDAEQLSDLYAHHRGGPAADRVHPFVRVGDAAFQVDAADLEKSWQALLCPAANPEVFELLQRSEATLLIRRGIETTPAVAGGRTGPHARHFVEEERRLFAELAGQPALYKVPPLEFQRVFWKTAQLAVAAASDRVRYAVTPADIERCLASAGTPLPGTLRGLAVAYEAELDGRSEDTGELVPEAITYLRRLVA